MLQGDTANQALSLAPLILVSISKTQPEGPLQNARAMQINLGV
jgi:hypothetical protein